MGEPRATLKTGYGAALLALAVVGFFGWLLAGQSGSATLSVFADTDTLMVVVAAGAAFTTAVSARLTRGRVRGAWLSLTVGLAGFTLGAAIWLYYAVAGRVAPFPSVADAAYLMLPIAAGVALLLLSTGLSRTSRTRLILDGLCVAASFSIIIWAAVLDEVWDASARDQLKIAVSLAYPVLDAAVLTIAVVVLARAQPGQRRTLALLTLAMVCIAVSDGVFVYLAATQRHVNADIVDVGWLAGMLLMAVAAATGRDFSVRGTVVAQPPSWASVWLPFIPVVTASVAALVQPPEEVRSAPIIVPSAILAFAFLARQLLVMRTGGRRWPNRPCAIR